MARVAKESATLVSSGGTNYFYTNRKNKKKGKGENKLKVRKYDPVARKHVLFEDKKLSRKKKANAAATAKSDAPAKDQAAA